jgi:hypothetical protein
MCNIPIYFCNIIMKHLQHTSKTSETFKMYTCNIHRILVQPPPSSASGRRSRSKRLGQRVSTPGPDASPCAAAVASWRLRESSPCMGAEVPAPSGEAGPRVETTAGRCGGAGERAAGVNVDGEASHRARAVGRPMMQEQVGSPSMCREGLSSPPFLIQPVQRKRRTQIP